MFQPGPLCQAADRGGLTLLETLTGRTRIHFLIGSPIKQVLAPGWLSTRMAKAGYDGLLVPLQIEKEDIGAAMPVLKAMPNVDSILVTLPHKFRAAEACDRLSPRAQILGAINAMRREPDGSWIGDNFDGAGMLRGLKDGGCEVEGRRAYVVGAGGAGSSIVISLLEEGASEVVFHDRDPRAHDALQAKLSVAFPGRSRVGTGSPEGCDVVINATSSGLRPEDPLPVDPKWLRPEMTVADVITDPVPTALLAEAQRVGCRTRDGTHMLEGQISLLFDFMLHKNDAPTVAADRPARTI
jgi:shikimate dehydrogenase